MSTQLPYPLPAEFDTSGPYRNPGQTIPSPMPTDMPVGLWRGERTTLDNWTANPVDDATVLWRVEWASPIFDMRPDLRSVSENRSNLTRSGVPVWGGNTWSSGLHLWAITRVLGANAPNVGQPDLRGLEVQYQEEGHVIDVTQLQTITPLEDVTNVFTNLGNSQMIAVNPWGTGNPVRYWRMRLRFQIRTNSTFVGPVPPVIVIQGAMY